jgi:hypothetical protein
MAKEQRDSRGVKIIRTDWKFDPSATSSAIPDSPSATSPATQAANSTPASQTGECAPHAQGHVLASGHRTPLLTPEQEENQSKQYCSKNDILSGLYDCSCFAQHMLAYRKEHDMCAPFVNVVQPVTLDPHFSACAGPSAQVAAYGDKRAQSFLQSNPQYAPQAENLSKCASDGFTGLFLAKPLVNANYIGGYFTTAMNRCVEKGH